MIKRISPFSLNLYDYSFIDLDFSSNPWSPLSTIVYFLCRYFNVNTGIYISPLNFYYAVTADGSSVKIWRDTHFPPLYDCIAQGFIIEFY